jgi:hypothetical protein
VKSVLAAIAVSLMCSLTYAQAAHRNNDVLGMTGSIDILPSPPGIHSVLVFESDVPLSATSSQIVFVLQADGTSLPPAWSGRARILTGDGFVGVAPLNAKQQWIVKFADREIPPSLAKMNFQPFEIVGIARYGEKMPLTGEQVTNLVVSGRDCSALAREKKTAEFSLRNGSGSASPMGIDPNPTGPQTCTSGGAGSSQCSAGGGGCTVTCNSGYNACCNANTNNCGCCQISE